MKTNWKKEQRTNKKKEQSTKREKKTEQIFSHVKCGRVRVVFLKLGKGLFANRSL
jgi:hypothetical protein